MKVEYISFKEREERSKYIAYRFRSILRGKILDVGCDKAFLKNLLHGIDYTGIDIVGNPDIQINLEEINIFPFADNYFDCVICSDVLEHLDNLHHVFGELIRVAKKYIIISLPNNWANARRPISRGKGSIAHYGLPIDPPQDRHKWFFSMLDAINFIKGQEQKYPISIIDLYVTEKPRPLIVRLFRKLLYPTQRNYLNRYAHTLWVVLKKENK